MSEKAATSAPVAHGTGAADAANDNVAVQDSLGDAADQDNPRQWSEWKKWTSVVILSFIEFLTPLASMMYAAAISQAAADLQSFDGSINSFSMTIYVLGFAIGPLVFAPLSDIYGRIWIYRSSMVLFLGFTAACGVAQNINMLIGFRFLAGCVGAAPIALGGAMIKEMFAEHNRGRAMSIYFVGPVAGPLLGPVFGGFISDQQGWRWVFWVVCILSGASIVAAFLLLRETHLPTIRRRKGHTPRVQALADLPTTPKTVALVTLRAWTQPFKILFNSLLIFLFFIFVGLLFGHLNLLASTLSIIYEQEYSFSISEAGLTYLSMGLGNVACVVLLSTVSDRTYEYLRRRGGGKNQPRDRLPYLILGAPLASTGLFWYGWSCQASSYWLVPLLGLFVFGFGVLAVVIPSNLYLLELFPQHAASAIAANTVARSVGGSTLPLAGTSLYQSCGYGWGNSLLAFLNLLCWLVPLSLYLTKKGQDIDDDHVSSRSGKT